MDNREDIQIIKTKKITLLLLVILFWGVMTRSQSPVRSFTLEESIQVGLTNATEILKGQNAVVQSGAQLLYAYGQYLPNLSLAGGYNYSGGNSLLTSAPVMATFDKSAYYYQLTSNVNIYSGQYNMANLKASILNKKSTELTLKWARQQVALDIIQSFLQLMLDKRLMKLLGENLGFSTKREEQITALTQVGRLTVVDLYQQQAQTSQDQAALSNAQNKVRTDKILFLNKLRLDAKDSLDNYDFGELPLDDQPQSDKYDNEQFLVNQALLNRVDLQSYKLNVDAAAWNIKKYQSGYLPKLSFELGAFNNGLYYDYLYYNGQEQLPASQNSIAFQLSHQIYGLGGINLTWNIFDNYYTKSNVINARALYSNAKIDYRDQELQIVSDTRQAFGDYKNDLQVIQTVDKGVDAAAKAFEAMQGRYTQGSASFIDVITTQVNLLNAKESQIQAIISLMLEKKTLDYLVGSNY
jgi:outer membrane protein